MVAAMTENNMGLLLPKPAPSFDFSIALWRLAADTHSSVILPLEAELVAWNLTLSLCFL